VWDVERVVAGGSPVLRFSKIGGGIPIYPEELAERVLEVAG